MMVGDTHSDTLERFPLYSRRVDLFQPPKTDFQLSLQIKRFIIRFPVNRLPLSSYSSSGSASEDP